MKKRVVAIILIALIGAASFFIYRYFSKRDNNSLKFSGELEMKRIDVSFRVPGQILKLYTDEGAAIKKDELLAELDPIEYQTQLKVAQADLGSAEWALSQLYAGSTKEELEQARKQLESAKAESANYKKDYDRMKKLYEANSISESDYDKTNTAYKVATAKVGELSERLKQMEIGATKETIEQAKAKVDAAKSNVALAEQKLGYTKISSPIGGVVLDKYREEAEYVQGGSPIFSIGNTNELWLRAYLPETQAHVIKLGQKMAVTVDSLPDKRFEGVVSFISSQAEFTPKQIQTSIERVKLVYRIKIDIIDTEGLLKPGIPADAVIWN